MRKSILDELENGKLYFLLGYHDRNLSVPFVEPYYFLIKNMFAREACDFWFFQGAAQFLEGAPTSTVEECENNGVIRIDDEGLQDFVDWQGLVDELSENMRLQVQGKFLSQFR